MQINPDNLSLPGLEEQTTYVQPIGADQIAEAERTLAEYKAGKSKLEERIREDDLWWRLRHFELLDREDFGKEYPSAWLFNSIMGKHAAAMENYPEPNILPRERADKDEAKRLSEILPVVMELNDFKETYSQIQWRKMTSGTGVYGVFWASDKHNGLGDIDIRAINILNLFWEPGVRDIQQSRNVFNVELVDEDVLHATYPDIDFGVGGDAISIKEYAYEDNIDVSKKRLVVDWYYKRKVNGVTQLHLCKYVGRTVLYSSENEGMPWYNDGEYPFVLDVLFPMEGSPAGFGFIDTGKYAQEQTDLLNQAIITNAMMNCRPRYFRGAQSSVNKQQFADWREQIVEVEGPMSEMDLRPIDKTGLDTIYVEVMRGKIEEIKETTSNQDVQTGASGAMAASAIQSLQESAGMPMKDATRGSYRAYEKVVHMVIERVRQFYEMPRMFRIMGDYGEYRFESYDNSGVQPISQGMDIDGSDLGFRKPEFDIEVIAQSETRYTKLKNNEDIINLYNMGFFDPANADKALIVLDMLDLPRKDKIIDHIKQYKTANDKMMQYAQMALALASKYEPQMAQGIMQSVQMDTATAQGMPMAPTAAPGRAPAQIGEAGIAGNAMSKREEQTRERVAATTKPGE